VGHPTANDVTHCVRRFEEHTQFPGVAVGLVEDPVVEGIDELQDLILFLVAEVEDSYFLPPF
jgi:hypothetical protein